MEYVYLKVKTGAGDRQVPLSSEPLTIGRHESNKLVLAEIMASRFHCVIERKDTSYILRDLQSRNGTQLNGQRVLNAMLKSGDVIAIGATSMTIVVHQSGGAGQKKFERTMPARPAAAPLAGGPAKPVEPPVEALDELDVVDELEVVEEEPAAPEPPLKVLRHTADALLNHNFDVDAISLINTRGKVAHDSQDATSGTSETVLLFRLCLLICFRSHASDIHLEPRAEDFLLRIRVDGNLIDITAFNKENGIKFSSLVKVLCELDTTQRSIVQEGHFAARAPNTAGDATSSLPNATKFRRVDYRVSLVPSLHGQKMVVRVFDTANSPLLVEHLGLPPKVQEHISKELTLDAGLIMVCGPTGSGKTTTLYSLLRSCGSSFRNIVTIEDPVEVQIEGTTQLPVDDAEGKSFAALLRSVLRQDPDVIMVGEIRDPETARIALQASMTGHLVLSTIHTRDTIGTVFRLMDLGIEPYMVAQGIHLVLAQRLVRTLCPSCKKLIRPTPDDKKRLEDAGAGTVERIYKPVGCPKCLGTGFYGRRAFFEFLAATDKLRDQILKSPTPLEMQATLKETDFVSLGDAGYRLVAQGLTSIDEVDRAVGR
jgi:type II secretory ATPase GspE/PulE/Tfp pilus assembly ATPase PilB-like protein